MTFLANPSLLNQIFLALLPVAAVSSQTLLDIILSFLFILLIVFFKKNRPLIRFEWIGIEWAFLGYIVTVILGFWLNASPDAEWLRSAIKFSWIVNLYILIFSLQTIEFNTVKIMKALSVLSLLPTLYSLASYINGFDLITGRDNKRITGLVNSATYHAHGNAVIFIFLAGCLFFSIKKLNLKWKVFTSIATFLLGLSILLTFTRGIWISISVSTWLILFFVDKKKLFYIFSVAFLTGWLAVQFWPALSEGVDTKNRAASVDERVSLIKLNVQMWKQYPLLGIGYGENLRRNREYWDLPEWNKPPGYIESHAHNQYLNVLSTTGIFGVLFFVSFLIFFLYKNFKLILKTSSKTTPERSALLIICLWAQIEFVMACVTDVSFEYAKIRSLILIVWAIVIVLDKKPSVVIE